MFADLGYLTGSESFYQETVLPLVISACGHYRMDKISHASTSRPNGLVDYQLLYIASGQGRFYFEEHTETLVTAGQMVLYRPGEAQKYIYLPPDNTDVYWIHFTGTQVEELLDTHGFEKHIQVYTSGILPEYQRLYQSMIQELQRCPAHFAENLTLLLKQLFIAFHRHQMGEHAAGQTTRQLITSAIEYFHEHYQEDINMVRFAAERNMSICWFIRSFKQYTGQTPLAYLIKIRISTAGHLLLNTSYSVNKIAAIVGYENPLYFCRLFKKHTGVSPTEYRRISKVL